MTMWNPTPLEAQVLWALVDAGFLRASALQRRGVVKPAEKAELSRDDRREAAMVAFAAVSAALRADFCSEAYVVALAHHAINQTFSAEEE